MRRENPGQVLASMVQFVQEDRALHRIVDPEVVRNVERVPSQGQSGTATSS